MRWLWIGLLALSLLLAGCSGKPPTPKVVPTPTETKIHGMTIRSWPIGTVGPGDPAYKIPTEAQAAVAKIQPSPKPAVAWEFTQWAKIRRWGYELEAIPTGGYKLTKNRQPVSEATILPYAIAFSDSDNRFALVLGDELLTEKGKQEWSQFRHLDEAPFFLGESMYWVQTKDERANAFQVVRDGEVLYEGALNPRAASIQLAQFRPWRPHWVVETVEAQVIIDGQRLGEAEGYNQAFFWQLFKDQKPFYLYEQDGKYGINWDSKELGLTYDQIFHGGCCDMYDFNPQLIKEGHAITLHAKQGDTWHYVLITQG